MIDSRRYLLPILGRYCRSIMAMVFNSVFHIVFVTTVVVIAVAAFDTDSALAENTVEKRVLGESAAGFDRVLYQSPDPVASVGGLSLSECRLASTSGIQRNVQCAWVPVPENWDDPESSRIELFVARIPARRPEPQTKDNPIIFFAGGPGQAASDAFLFVDRPFHKLAKTRDFYLIDQRGTGLSHPLSCAQAAASERDNDPEHIKAQAKACLSTFTVDPRNFTTQFSVRDFEAVRQMLGVTQWNIYGVSYGTRVATTYASMFPDAVRTMMLDSALPADHSIISDIGPQAQRALDQLFAECAAKLECAQAFPNIETVFYRFLTQSNEVIPVSIEDLSQGGIRELTFSKQQLLQHVRLSLYSAQSRAVLLAQLHDALVNKNYAPIIRASELNVANLEASIFSGLHHSIICAEEVPYLAQNKQAIVDKNQSTFLGTQILDVNTALCDVWKVEQVSEASDNGVSGDNASDNNASDKKAALNPPLVTDIPTLLLAGELDPITPPDYAKKMHRDLKNSKVLLFKGRGHSVGFEGCAPSLLVDFVDQKDVGRVDAACLARLHALPNFINLNSY